MSSSMLVSSPPPKINVTVLVDKSVEVTNL